MSEIVQYVFCGGSVGGKGKWFVGQTPCLKSYYVLQKFSDKFDLLQLLHNCCALLRV